jgi:hypothetical protein
MVISFNGWLISMAGYFQLMTSYFQLIIDFIRAGNGLGFRSNHGLFLI